VDRCVARLVRAGFLEKHKRRHELGESNVYVVHEIVARQETLNPKSRGRGTNGAGVGAQTVRPLGTQTVRELEPIQLEATDPSEWAPMPDSVRAMLNPPTPGDPA
jgi:hypothetical protein